MALPWVLSNPIFTEVVFPFVLVFVLIFAILEKAKILGEDKRQLDALVSLSIALIFVTFSNAVSVINKLMPILAILAVIILIFMILFGFMGADSKESYKLPLGVKIAGMIIVTIVMFIAIAIATGYWGQILTYFQGDQNQMFTTVIFFAIVIGAIAVVLSSGKKKD